MRKSLFVLMLPVAVLVMALAVMAEEPEKPWFDMVNCEFCKHLMDDPELLNHTTWEHFNITNGIINVTTVDKEYLDSYHAAGEEMMKVGKRLMDGEKVQMCGSCQAHGTLIQAGAKMEHIETQRGHVMLVTSDNPEMVAKIQAWAKRNIDELAKLEAREK